MARLRATAPAARSVLDGREHDGILDRVGAVICLSNNQTIKRRSQKAMKKRADAYPPLRRRQLAEWRAKRPVRAIAFHPVILPDGRDADGVVHVHPEHRLVRRLISRFVCQDVLLPAVPDGIPEKRLARYNAFIRKNEPCPLF